MAEQGKLNLVNGLQSGYRTAGNELLSDIRDVIRLYVPKRFVIAEDLGIKESHLSDALNGNGKNFDVRWLPAVCRYDGDNRIPARVAAWRGLKVVEKDPLTPEEQVEALKRKLARTLVGDIDEWARDAYEEYRP